MTSFAQRPLGRPIRAAVLLALTAAATTGCASAQQYARDDIVGIRAAPTEQPAAAVTETSAQSLAQRAIEAAAAAEKDIGATGDARRQAAMAGPALTVARAHAQVLKKHAATATSKRSISADKVRVLSISSGRQWPRTIFATSSGTDGTQQLHLLVSTAARAPYRVTATATMQPGASLPAFADLGTGATPVRDPALVATPGAVVAEYAAAMGYPKPATAKDVGTGDAFSSAVRKQAGAQNAALKDLATFTQKHQVQPGSLQSVSLRSGGAVVFGLLKRTDAITLGPKAKELKVPKPLSELIGRERLTKRAELQTYEAVVLTVPVKGKAKAALVAIDEQLLAGRGQ